MKNDLEIKNDLLVRLDDFEEQLELMDLLKEKVDGLKKEIKTEMVKVAKENGLEQIKWTTPKGTKITCSIGHIAEIEKQKVKEFDVEILKKTYPHIYEECIVEKEKSVIVKNATSDTLRITK